MSGHVRLEREAEHFTRHPDAATHARNAGVPEVRPAPAARLGATGIPLPAVLKAGFESRTGVDLSGVRLHPTPLALHRTAVGAAGFTLGQDIVVGDPARELSRPGGSSTLAHEIAHVVQHSGGTPPGATAVLSSAGHDGKRLIQGNGGISDADAELIRIWLAEGGGNSRQPLQPAGAPFDPFQRGGTPPGSGPPSSASVICNVNCHQTPSEQREESARRAEEQRRWMQKKQEERRQAAMAAAWPGLHKTGHAAELDRQATTLQGDIDASRQAEAQLRLQMFDRALATSRGNVPGSASQLTKEMKESWARAEQAAAVLNAVFRVSANDEAPPAVTDPLRPWFIGFYASISSLLRREDVSEARAAAAPKPTRGAQCPGGCHQPITDKPRFGTTGDPWSVLGPPTSGWADPQLKFPEPVPLPEKDIPAGWHEQRLGAAVTSASEARTKAAWQMAIKDFRWFTGHLDGLLLAELKAAGGNADLVENFEYTKQLRERQEQFQIDYPRALKVQAVFYPEEDVTEKPGESGQPNYVARAIPWQFYLVRTPEPTSDRYIPGGFEWQLHDLTAPKRDQRYVKTREKLGDLSALIRERNDPKPVMQMPVPRKLFEELDHEDFFAKGHLYWRDPVTNKPDGMEMTAKTSFWTWLGRIGLGIAVIGGIVFMPLSAPGLIAIALGTGVKLVAGYARLQEKKEHGVWTQADTDQFHWELAQDILSAVTLGVGRLGVVAAQAGNLARTAKATQVWFALRRVEAGVNLVNIAVVTHDLVKQFAAIQAAVKAGKMTKAQADSAYAQLTVMAAGVGLLSIIQFKGAMRDLTGRPALLLTPDASAPGGMAATLDVLPAAKRTLQRSANLSSRQLARRPADLQDEFDVVQAAPKRMLTGGDYEAEVILPNGHVWRRQPGGRWCRFSDDPLCFVFGTGGGFNVQTFATERVARQGEWSGNPGNSDFTPNNPVALRRAGFRPIPYVNNYPVFTTFAEATVLLRRADLAIKDRDLHDRLADALLARQRGWFLPGTNTPDGARVAALRGNPADPMTWHHVEGDNVMQLVPRPIHQAAQHAGGFSED